LCVPTYEILLSIFATVRGSIPKRRAASRRLIPSI
jgi:hypothetical protein